MRLVALKVVDKKVKDLLLKEKDTILLLVEKIILLVEIHLLVGSKIKKIVQIIQPHQGVSLDKKVKDHLLKEKDTILLLVVKAMFHLVVKNLLVVKAMFHLVVKAMFLPLVVKAMFLPLVVAVEKHLLLEILVVAVEKHLLLEILVVAVEKHLLLEIPKFYS
jgi:hypothetical protein